MWAGIKGSLEFNTVQTVVIDEWRLGLSVKVLQLCILVYILVDFFFLCSHLEIDTSGGGGAFVTVTDLTDMMFNATPAAPSCQESLGSRTPFNGAPAFKTYENVRLRPIPGQGWTRHEENSLTINTLIESDAAFDTSCGLLMQNSSCNAITGPTPYSEVFGASSVASADAKCILDWERYVVMLSATWASRHAERPLTGIWMQAAPPAVSGDKGERIQHSKTRDNKQDWLEEALPAVRKHLPFRSRYWDLMYLSLPTLLRAVGVDSLPTSGITMLITLHFTNRVPWYFWGRHELDVLVNVTKETFHPFRVTRGAGAHVHSAWHTGGVKVVVRATATVATFTWAKCGIALVSYSSYLLVAMVVVKFMLLHGHSRGLQSLTQCLCYLLHCGSRKRLRLPGASNSWYRSLLLRRSPEINSKEFSLVRLDVDAHEKPVGLGLDQHTFVITDIKEGSLIDEWNTENLERKILVGDIVMQVNGFSKNNPCRALDQLNSEVTHGTVEMVIRHSRSNVKEEVCDLDVFGRNSEGGAPKENSIEERLNALQSPSRNEDAATTVIQPVQFLPGAVPGPFDMPEQLEMAPPGAGPEQTSPHLPV